MGKGLSNYFGIDFGTTSSAVVGYMVMDHKPEKFLYGDQEGRPVPSVIAIDKTNGQVFTGRDAWDKKMELSESCEYISSVKTILDEDIVYNIAGKCCESGDMIAKGVEITKPLCDDILCVFSTGAYCYSMSMNYNGLTRPGVIFVNEDKITEAIRKETYEELVKTCNFKF